MNKARAFFLACTPQPIRMCAAAAKISTQPGSAVELYDAVDPVKGNKLIGKVTGLGHVTIMEHAVFNIAFEDVSMMFEQFLIDHRIAAYTIKSRRYVDYSFKGALTPKMRYKTISGHSESAQQQYEKLTYELFEAYRQLKDLGIPAEDARYVLPYSLRSQIYCTMNARELKQLIHHCLYGHGRPYLEFRAIGKQLQNMADYQLPPYFTEDMGVDISTDRKEKKLKDLFNEVDEAFTQREEPRDMPQVELFESTEDGSKSVAAAAFMNSTGCSFGSAFEAMDDYELVDKTLGIICSEPRARELEQFTASFRLGNMSLPCLTHLARHRLHSPIIPAFADMIKRPTGLVPYTIRDNPAAEKIYDQCFEKSYALYKDLEAEGIMKEDLAYLMLCGNTVDVQTTMNGRELFHFFKLRRCNRAQWEIRDYANALWEALMVEDNHLFRYAGPDCVTKGKCPEGAMSCGEPLTQ